MYKNNSLAAKRHGICRFLCNFVGMKQNLLDIIRGNENLRLALLEQEGGIMKFWAQHPEDDFDITLFENYEKQIVDDYFLANTSSRPLNRLRNKPTFS